MQLTSSRLWTPSSKSQWPTLHNWLPDSGAKCHYTPVFSNLWDIETCHIPVSLADRTTKISTFKGTTNCYFTTDEGQRSILGLTDVYFIEGLSHPLHSLTAMSATQNFTVIIRNRATTICFPNNSKDTGPLLLHELPAQQAFSTMSQRVNATPSDTTFSPAFEQHVDTTQHPDTSRPTTSLPLVTISCCLAHRNFQTLSDTTFSPAFEQHDDTTQQPDTSRPTTSLPFETISCRLAHRNFQNLMTGSLHNAWNNHTL